LTYLGLKEEKFHPAASGPSEEDPKNAASKDEGDEHKKGKGKLGKWKEHLR
jgi:hypothetical protein